MQSQNEVSAYFKRHQILYYGFSEYAYLQKIDAFCLRERYLHAGATRLTTCTAHLYVLSCRQDSGIFYRPYLKPRSAEIICKKHRNQMVCFQFEIIINVSLALSDSFEYYSVCYGSTVITNIFTLTVRGSTLVVRI